MNGLQPPRLLMTSREETPVGAARSTAGAEREIKFTLPAARAHVARGWLERLCRRDPKYPAAIVWTLYYDTPGLASLGEKINSDYLKRKIRVRWYSDLAGQVSGPAFVEAKLRIGTRRMKVRKVLPFPASEVARWDLRDSRWLSFPRLLYTNGILGVEPWQPMLLIRYRRDRFVESHSGTRVSLDTDIGAVAAHPRLLPAPLLSPLAAAVLEVKGHSESLPPPLYPLLALGAHKAAFSKFLAVYAHAARRVL
jgi:hypothetical protein